MHSNRDNSVCIPALILSGANAYVLWNEHWEHWSHMPPLEERPEYPYQNIRTKNYQWGDGDKVSKLIFHVAIENTC
jgi:cytochrome c oxidase subunit 6a